jgi:hypothetical protein
LTAIAVMVTASPRVAQASEPAPPPAQAAKEPSERRVWVHLDGPTHVVVQESATSDEWRDACVAPCDAWVGGGPFYRVVGRGLGSPVPFRLWAPDGEHETVTVHPPAPGLVALGVAAGGAAVVIGGLGLLIVELIGDGGIFDGESGGTPPLSTTLPLLGMVVAGVVTATGGVILVKLFQSTRVTQTVDTKPSIAAASDPGAPRPMWSRATTESMQAPPLAFVPLVSGSF